MAVKLPLFSDLPAQRYTIALEGVQYEVRLVWRERTGAWYLDLADQQGAWLLRGRRLSPGSSLNLGLITDGPPGALTAVGADPYAQGELELWYLDAAELAAAAVDPTALPVRHP